MAEEKEAPQGPAYKIGSRTYPFPSRFLLGDPVLVRELTGLDWVDFVDRLPDEDSPPDELPDPIVELGLIGCAIWHQHPTWRRDRVVRYTLGLAQTDVEFVGPEEEEPLPEDAPATAVAAVGDAGPPAPTATEQPVTATETTPAGQTPAEPLPSGSGSGSDSTSEAPSQQPSGPPATPAGAPA